MVYSELSISLKMLSIMSVLTLPEKSTVTMHFASSRLTVRPGTEYIKLDSS